ncbi:hypothetical protein G6F22_020430 [Rhizopus arrhizus]|nr:hypothetical protein G6F22_020430 [Rhizopus arrhizus]
MSGLHNPGVEQLLLPGGIQTEFTQDLPGVLAAPRRALFLATWRRRARQPGDRHAAWAALLAHRENPLLFDLRVGQEAGVVGDFSADHAMPVQALDPMCRRLGTEDPYQR